MDGSILRARREDLGLSQREVAEAIGRSRLFVIQLERNEAKPTAADLRKLGAVLDLAVDLMLDWPPAPTTTTKGASHA